MPITTLLALLFLVFAIPVAFALTLLGECLLRFWGSNPLTKVFHK